MKSLFSKAGIALLICFHVSSCRKITDFLETPPGVSLNEDKIFGSKILLEQYLSTGYVYSIPSNLPKNNATYMNGPSNTGYVEHQTINANFTDESEATASFANHNWNTGSIGAERIINDEDQSYYARFSGLRVANLILKRIDEVPELSDTERDQYRAEAYFLRAMNNFETFKRYGGIQKVDKVLGGLESNKIPRITVEETVNFIVEDCNLAFSLLPAGFPLESQTGRVNKSAIAALKARTLLFAASPLFNTGAPYLSMPSAEDNKLICYGNYDKERWKLAIDATKNAIAVAESESFRLLDDTTKRHTPDNLNTPITLPFRGNYRTAWETADNKEIILSYRGYARRFRAEDPWRGIQPNVAATTTSRTGQAVNHAFVKKYEVAATGQPQVWPTTGTLAQLNALYRPLDPRFVQTVAYNGSRLYDEALNRTIQTYVNGSHYVTHSSFTGAWMMKLIPDALGTAGVVPVVSVFRYNELLLNLAEALNEYEDAPSKEAYDLVNRIRLRSGLLMLPGTPDADRPFDRGVDALGVPRRAGVIPGPRLTKDQFRQKLRNERALELAFENYRFWDIRRWLIAEGTGGESVLNGDVLIGLKLTSSPSKFDEFVAETRTFTKKMYLNPFPTSEILRNSLIVQNPGY